jgi:hypothetical protein
LFVGYFNHQWLSIANAMPSEEKTETINSRLCLSNIQRVSQACLIKKDLFKAKLYQKVF